MNPTARQSKDGRERKGRRDDEDKCRRGNLTGSAAAAKSPVVPACGADPTAANYSFQNYTAPSLSTGSLLSIVKNQATCIVGLLITPSSSIIVCIALVLILLLFTR